MREHRVLIGVVVLAAAGMGFALGAGVEHALRGNATVTLQRDLDAAQGELRRVRSELETYLDAEPARLLMENIRTKRIMAVALDAANARADEAQRQRDAAVAVLKRVQADNDWRTWETVGPAEE
jgi:hypothetical protein